MFSSSPKIDLFFKCKGLLDMDVFSKSDPQVWVYLSNDGSIKNEKLVGKTETIKDSLNPVFSTKVTVDYNFEQNQLLRFVVVDIDKPNSGIDKQDLIGTVKISLGEIVSSPGMAMALTLVNDKLRKPGGKLFVTAEEVIDTKKSIALLFHATKLDSKDGLFGKSDPFLRIYRQRESGDFDAVYKTEHIKNTLNPSWKQFSISFQHLANGDLDRTLKIDVVDWNKDGSEDNIGSVITSTRSLQEMAGSVGGMEIINEKYKLKKKKYKNSGILHCKKCEMKIDNSFLDYLRGGMEIGLVIGVDFTASNGNPADRKSLHYLNDAIPNDYVTAIQEVGQILANYDSDNKFPSYGFGARIPPHGHVSHCFPLNFNEQDPEILGITNVLGYYRQALQSVKLSGPTNFAAIIESARDYSKGCTATNLKYTILLILTDGVICDLAKTIDRIVASSTEALSIVIVGVGNADFSTMDKLDADVTPLIDSSGRKMARDIVQFVPYREFKNKGMSSIAEVTLKEIPEQVVGFMSSRGIAPPKPTAPNTLYSTQSIVSPSLPYPTSAPAQYASNTLQSAPSHSAPYAPNALHQTPSQSAPYAPNTLHQTPSQSLPYPPNPSGTPTLPYPSQGSSTMLPYPTR
eukprot:CFRG7607T1